MILTKIAHIEFDIKFVSGGRVSGGGGPLEIGGVVDANLSAILDPMTGQPYLPGSSIKGKVRSIVEKITGQTQRGEPCGCGQLTCPVCPLFGAHKWKNNREPPPSSPTRITVRDAFLTAASLDERKLAEHEPMEHKTEVIIGRASGKGEHPRTGERVPAGTSFRAHIVVHLFDADLPDRAAAFKATLANALKVLEDSESIGASGSRGYGEIKLGPVTWREVEVNSLRIAFDETT